METKESFAVVTGASQGLGKEFVKALAKKKINVILISLPGQNLRELCHHVAELYEVKTHFYEVDLSVNENVMELTEWLNKNFNIHILINNAGLGGTKRFLDASHDYINNILQVNVTATSLMTHQLLPNLLKQPQSYILNVSSMAAFSPIGVVNPGAMSTNADVAERINKQGFLGKLTLLDPEKVAEYCISQLFKKDSVIMVNPISWPVMKILPIWIKLPLMTQAIKREIEA